MFGNHRGCWLVAIAFILAGPFFGFDRNVWAGASASQWVIAVNGASQNSRTLANHYVSFRNIPMRNVVVLNDIPNSDLITVNEFREKILGPLLKEIDARGISPHIQGIAYSADFPTAIALDEDLKDLKDRSPYQTPVGSINGMTYLYRFVMSKNPSYIGFETNWYASRDGNALLNVSFGTPEQRLAISSAIMEKKHETAASLLDELTDIAPHPFPIHYLAAREWALAGNVEYAIKRLEKAVNGGWHFRKQIEADEALASIRLEKDYERILAKCPDNEFRHLPTRGFDARLFYSANSLTSPKHEHGVSYLLSMVLGVTRDLGITQAEAIEHLKRSASADYSRPHGAFLFTSTPDVRTKTRQGSFDLAIEKLKLLGHDARVITTILPASGEKCSGLMLGTPEFQWSQCGAELLPGSIAENLTSIGAAMTTPGQTKSTELLRFGAAATSGTVTEPYTIPPKFPHPMIFVHYAEGLTAAEAFYASVVAPYQLLIVGDPLCQPYAKPPRFQIRGIENEQLLVSGASFRFEDSDSEHDDAPERIALLWNGQLKTEKTFETFARIQTAGEDLGAHEMRFLTRSLPPLENRFEQTIWLRFGTKRNQVTLKAPAKCSASAEKPFKLTVEFASRWESIEIRHDWETIGTIDANSDSIEIPANTLGLGPVRLQAIVKEKEGMTTASLPVIVNVEP